MPTVPMKNLIRLCFVLALAPTVSVGHADSSLPRSAPEAQGVSSPALLEFVTTLDEKIDGMHSLSPESPLAKDLAAADAAAEDFGKAFSAYLQRNLGLEERWDEDTNSFRFRMKRDTNPLIPADKHVAAGWAVRSWSAAVASWSNASSGGIPKGATAITPRNRSVSSPAM